PITSLFPYTTLFRSSIWKTTMLKTYVLECFLKDVARLNHPLIIPLGVNVANVLAKLSESSALIQERRILTGFPHPSGANGHRHNSLPPIRSICNGRSRLIFVAYDVLACLHNHCVNSTSPLKSPLASPDRGPSESYLYILTGALTPNNLSPFAIVTRTAFMRAIRA